jgi:hypothetical protein
MPKRALAHFAKMTAGDLGDMIALLRSLPPKQ